MHFCINVESISGSHTYVFSNNPRHTSIFAENLELTLQITGTLKLHNSNNSAVIVSNGDLTINGDIDFDQSANSSSFSIM